MEDMDDPPEGEEAKSSFLKVIETIRAKCGLQTPAPREVVVTQSRAQRQYGPSTRRSVPCTLPRSDLAEACLRKMEDQVAGSSSTSLATKKSKLLPPVPLRRDKQWYEFSDSPSTTPRSIPPELAELVESSKEALANKGTHVSSSELMVMESMAMNTIQAASWMDHWLYAVMQVLGDSVPQDTTDLLLSGGRTLTYICNQASALWTTSVLKRRDAALGGSMPLSAKEKQALRNSSLLDSEYLFPAEKVSEVGCSRKAKQESSFMGNVAKLASNSQKASYRPPQSQSSSSGQKRKRTPAPQPPKANKGGQASALPSSSPAQTKKGGQSFQGQGTPRRGKGKGKGRGSQ